MRPRNRKLLFFIGLAALVSAFIYLNINGIVRHIYHNRYFDGPPMETKRKGLRLSSILNFKFTLDDSEFVNSFSNLITPGTYRSRTVSLEVNGEKYAVELSAFGNYFKNIRLNDVNRSFSLQFPKKNYYKRIRRFDVFQVDKIDLFEQELIYDLAEKLDIYVPYTEYVDLQIHGVHDRISFFKQSFDDIFLARYRVPGSIIFMMENDSRPKGKRDHGWKIDYLYNHHDHKRYPGLFKHLDNFFKLLNAGDENLLLKYFDLDYIARFEMLRELLGAGTGFLMEDNIKFIYNTFNGKFYPVLDESNLYNMQTGRKNKTFKLLRRQIKGNPSIAAKKKVYMVRLAESYNKLFTRFKNLETQYTSIGERSLHNKLRVKLISSYFRNNVYKTLEEFKRKGHLPEAAGTVGTMNEFYLNANTVTNDLRDYQPLSESLEYLDQVLLAPARLESKYRNLNLTPGNDNRIQLKKGNYTLRKTVFFPRGYILEIEAGTVFNMAPGTSFISFSPLHIWGSEEEPVIVRPLKKKKSFGVWAVNGGKENLSIIEQFDFSGASSAVEAGCVFPGGLNFHETNVEIRNSRIHHNRGHDALNVKWGKVVLENNQFYSNSIDHAALDFCKGVVIGNRFTDDTDDREGDALDLSDSQFFVCKNDFAQFVDKGLSIGEDSRCFLYDNIIRQNRIGAASKNRARVVVMANKFYDNTRAIAAYQKEPMFGGGFVYLFDNDFKANDQFYKVDGDSLIYILDNHDIYKEQFDYLVENKQLDGIFSVIDGIIEKFKYEKNGIETFFIGSEEAEIDEKNKVIFAALPQGTATSCVISYSTRLENAEVFIKPVFCGTQTPDRKTNVESKLINGQSYDFIEYVFHGKIILKYKFQRAEYDLYVTTGTLPVIEIDTSGEHGIPRIIKDEPKTPCKIRIFSAEKKRIGKGTRSKAYTNRILDAQIEGRGKKFPKWKYGITLDDSFPLEGMINARHWVLESSFIEKSLMRSKIAFDLLEQFREEGKGRRIAPQSRYVEVILNGNYFGVYILIEHIDRNFLRLEAYDRDKDFNSVLYRARNTNANFTANNFEASYDRDFKHFPGRRQPLEKADDPIWGWHSGFEQRYPDKQKYGEYWQPIETFTRFTSLAPDSRFNEHIFRLLDRDNYIDLWIFTQLIDDSDGLFKNRYIARDRGSEARWFIIPWDKDGILGRRHDMEKRPPTEWLTSPLFERCMRIDSFRFALKERWKELRRKGIISETAIYKMIEQNMAVLGDAGKRNFVRWPANYYLYPDILDFRREIDYMKEWIRKRIQWLDTRIVRLE
jgi:spore coat protein CotH